MAKTKNCRIEVRISKEHKEILEYAAYLSNISLSSYIVSCSLKQALKDINKESKIILNDAERDRFIKMMLNPPKPNSRLKKLLKDVKIQS